MKRTDLRKISRGTYRKIGLLFLIFCLFAICLPFSYLRANQTKNMLVLHSYHKGQGWNDDITRGIESVLRNMDQEIELYFEYMDTKRIYDAEYLQYLYELYRHKFRNRRFDAVVSSDDHAFNFLLAHHQELFPDKPVVFCGVNDFEDSMLVGHNLITGVVESFDIKSTIDVALKLHPSTKQVFVIVDKTLSGTAGKKLLIKAIPYFKDAVRFTFLEDLDMSEVHERVKELPLDSIVYLIHYTTDKSGNTFSLEDSCVLISRNCAVPIYSSTEAYLGRGIVGGMLVSGFAQGEKAGQIALRILRGEEVKNIPVVKKSPNLYEFDYHQMQRFGIKLSSLPEGSIVINKPYSFYSKYKRLVWWVIASIAGLVLIILILSSNVITRKRAEKALRESEERFRNLFEQSNDAVIIHQSGKIIDMNKRTCEMLGHNKEQLLTMSIPDLHPEKDRPDSMKRIDTVQGGEQMVFETQWMRADGTLVDVEVSSRVVDRDKGIIQGITRDITERKRAEGALRESERQASAAIEAARGFTFSYDIATGKIEWGGAIEEITGYTPEEFSLVDIDGWADRIHPDDRDRILSVLKEASQRDRAAAEYRFRIKNGDYITLSSISITEKDEEGKAFRLVGILQDITERKRAEDQIKASLEEKEVLLREIHHRVKNNMQTITSLLRIQCKQIKEKKYIDMFKDSLDRIQSMSFVHEKLYQSKDFASVDFNQYVKTLVSFLFRSHGVDTNKIAPRIEVEDVSLSIETAIPCGLLINELITNSLKYAFPEERKGELKIALRSISEDEFELIVSDDGIGIPEDLDIEKTESFGIDLIRLLVDQLDGQIELDRTGGTKFNIRIKRQKYKPRI